MFRIGEFSKIAQTAVSQLRYYDQIGLFEPEYTDDFTSYRYYRATQLPDLNRILAMKELGLTLKQIKRLVAEEVSAEEIRGMLRLKKAQVEQEIHAKVTRLHHIEARIRQVEQQGELSPNDIVIKAFPAQSIYGTRVVCPHPRHGAAYRMEMTRLVHHHISHKKLGHFIAVVHEEALTFNNVNVEMGFLLNKTVNKSLQLSSGQKLAVRTLPPVEKAACVVRVGGPEKGYESYSNIGRWLEANDYQMAGPIDGKQNENVFKHNEWTWYSYLSRDGLDLDLLGAIANSLGLALFTEKSGCDKGQGAKTEDCWLCRRRANLLCLLTRRL